MPYNRIARIFLCSVAFLFGGAAFAQADDVPALQIVTDVAKPGTIVPANPAPATSVIPAASPAATPSILSGATAFPVTQKVQSDTLNPGATPTAPIPAPDVAASLAQPPPSGSVAPKKIVPKTRPAVKIQPKKKPPLPKSRPAIVAASPEYAAQARAATLAAAAKAPPPPEPILTHPQAGPKMPSVKPGTVVAEPLNDPLANQLLSPDKKALVRAIEAKANGQPAPKDISAPSVPVSSQVKIPAENLNGALLPAAVPHTTAAGEKAFAALPFKAGVTTLDAATAAQLQARILPLLQQNARWYLRIDAYASPVNDEPLNARRIALSRALAIRAWLLDHGVEAQRLDLRAQGPEAGHNPADQTDLIFTDDAPAH